MTIGEAYGPAMAITDQAEADAYFEKLVEWAMQKRGCTWQEASHGERDNLAYYAGYYDHETRLRVERLFKCEHGHPVFGPATNGAPTPEQAFKAGMDFARKAREA